MRHVRFVCDHHRKNKKIALVTDSLLGEAAEQIANHFLAATIKHFSFSHLDEARTWLTSH